MQLTLTDSDDERKSGKQIQMNKWKSSSIKKQHLLKVDTTNLPDEKNNLLHQHDYFSSIERSRKTCSNNINNYVISLLGIFYTALLVGKLVEGTAPTIDYSHNMRILKLPKSTEAGSIVYRLRASDADPNSQLVFGVSGVEARALLDVQAVPGSWNEADVYLRSSLADSPAGRQYNLSVYVSDGNTSTQVESSIFVTEFEPHQNLPAALLPNLDQDTQKSHLLPNLNGAPFEGAPFVSVKRVLRVPENSEPDESIGTISALERPTSELPVRFELRGRGADKFSIKYIFGPRGQSKAELLLAQRLDYERQNLFNLKVLALNAWTDFRYDTRNVASLDIVISVTDVQDTPPVFRNLPHSLKLANSLQVGQLICTFQAEDGDLGDDQRSIQFALDASSSLANYFDIGRESGQLRLNRPLAELLADPDWLSKQTSGFPLLGVLASEQPDASSYDHMWPPMYTKIELPLMLVELHNESPKFLGGWQSNFQPTGSSPEELLLNKRFSKVLHAYLFEHPGSSSGKRLGDSTLNAPLQVHWYTNGSDSSSKPSVIDTGLGQNGTFELSLAGPDASLFELEPSVGQAIIRRSSFSLSALPGAESTLFDYESASSKRTFLLEITARDYGTPNRLSSSIAVSIELVNLNDNFPHFEQDLYTFSLYENASPGQVLGQVKARDPDSSMRPTITPILYGPLMGRDSHLFKLDSETGQISLEGSLDRERRSQYLFSVSAQDQAGQTNYSQLQVNVLDVNDNAPTFVQTHYETVLLADGTFQQPLQVRAIDADEPGTANSQVAYEIIAGNQNEQFSVDTLTGSIYPSANPPSTLDASNGLTLPSILSEPIVPYGAANLAPDQVLSGNNRIIPSSREIEETTTTTTGNSLAHSVRNQTTQLHHQSLLQRASEPAQAATLDLLLNLESNLRSSTTAELPLPAQQLVDSAARQLNALRVPPVSNLVVRAHDFGIPVRSSTVRVSIYNHALTSRSLSVILNGSAEQLEPRREAIERAMSSLTGARVSVESIDALSESSSISVARLKLATPHHSLVDLTDLSALINALEFRYVSSTSNNFAQFTGNLTSSSSGNQQQQIGALGSSSGVNPGLYSSNEVHSFALEANGLERRLLIYIIMVAVCILALLVIWMVYSCSREEREARILEKSLTQISSVTNTRLAPSNNNHLEGAGAANQLTEAKRALLSTNPLTNQLLGKAAGQKQQTRLLGGGPTLSMTDQTSLYNGQLWFCPQQPASSDTRRIVQTAPGYAARERRASSAPSAGTLNDRMLVSVPAGGSVTPRSGAGQFFPNPRGYTENLASLSVTTSESAMPANFQLGRRGRRQRKVAPAPPTSGVPASFGVAGEESPVKPPRGRRAPESGSVPNELVRSQRVESANSAGSGSGSGSGSGLSRSASSLSCDSPTTSCHSGRGVAKRLAPKLAEDQQLLGYDDLGTPIVATRRETSNDGVVIDVSRLVGGESSVPAAPPPPPPPPPPLGPPKGTQLEPAEWADRKRELLRGDLMSELHERLSQRNSSSGEQQQQLLPAELHHHRASSTKEREFGDDANDRVGSPGSSHSGSSRKSVGSLGVLEEEPEEGVSGSLRDMRNGELLERASIFDITYGGLATSKLPQTT